MVVSEEIRAAGLSFSLSQDGYCYQREPILELLNRGIGHQPESPGMRRLWRAFETYGRLSGGDILALAELCAGAPARPAPSPPPLPAPPAFEPERPKPGVDYVLRRLMGVLFLTPFLVVVPVAGLLIHLAQLALAPNRTLRSSRFRFRQAVSDCVRFALYEDFTRVHSGVMAATVIVYAAVAAWSLWFPVQDVLAK